MRARKLASQLLVAEWAVEQAATPRHVSVSFVVHSSSEAATGRSTIRRFLLSSESAVKLIDNMKEVLVDCAAAESLACETSEDPVEDVSAAYARQNDGDEVEAIPGHFALGAYGLVGN